MYFRWVLKTIKIASEYKQRTSVPRIFRFINMINCFILEGAMYTYNPETHEVLHMKSATAKWTQKTLQNETARTVPSY